MKNKSESKINQRDFQSWKNAEKEYRWIIWPIWYDTILIINGQPTKWQVNPHDLVEDNERELLCDRFVNNVQWVMGIHVQCSSPVARMNEWISVFLCVCACVFYFGLEQTIQNSSFVIESNSTITNNKQHQHLLYAWAQAQSHRCVRLMLQATGFKTKNKNKNKINKHIRFNIVNVTTNASVKRIIK